MGIQEGRVYLTSDTWWGTMLLKISTKERFYGYREFQRP